MNELRAKVALLYKTKEEWERDKTYVPQKGEMCLCEYPDGNIFPKVGNGVDVFEDLEWLKGESGELKLYFGASYDPPTDISGMTKVPGFTKSEFIKQGMKITKKIDITVDPDLEIGQYPAIAMDKSFKLVGWKQAAAPDFPSNSFVTVDKGDYKLYYLSSRVTKSIEYLFIFEMGD